MIMDKNIIHFNENELQDIKEWYNKLNKIYNNNIYTYKYYNKEGMLVNFFTNEDLKNYEINWRSIRYNVISILQPKGNQPNENKRGKINHAFKGFL